MLMLILIVLNGGSNEREWQKVENGEWRVESEEREREVEERRVQNDATDAMDRKERGGLQCKGRFDRAVGQEGAGDLDYREPVPLLSNNPRSSLRPSLRFILRSYPGSTCYQ
jgi:hypothetical protein